MIYWRVEPEDRKQFGDEFKLNEEQLDWIFDECYGIYEPLAICATYNRTPFVKRLWPIDKGFADYAAGCYFVIRVGGLEDAMRYGLMTINPDGRIDNIFSIYAPWDSRSVLATKQFFKQTYILTLFVPMKALIAHGACATQTGAIVTTTKVPFKEVQGVWCARANQRQVRDPEVVFDIPSWCTGSRTPANMERMMDVVTLFVNSPNATRPSSKLPPNFRRR